MRTILVVEDTRTELEIIRQKLEAAGIAIETAGSGEEALSKLEQIRPDAIFLDVVLPGKSGFEICRAIKSNDDINKIPVVICSTKNTDMDKFWGKRQGADHYLCKPIDSGELNNVLSQLFN
jgi:two-component system, chemotaxis family, response regulator PixH